MREQGYIVSNFAKEYVTPTQKVEMLFRIHKGFKTEEELNKLLILKEIDFNYVIKIKFLNMYYGVIYEDYNKICIIGEIKTFCINKSCFMEEYDTELFNIEFTLTKIKEHIHIKPTLAFDLIALDSNIEIVFKDNKVKIDTYKDASYNTYLTILALSFVDYYFSKDEVFVLTADYFDEDYSYIFNSNIVGINPFKNKIVLNNGCIKSYEFLKNKDYNYSNVIYLDMFR